MNEDPPFPWFITILFVVGIVVLVLAFVRPDMFAD